MGRKCQHICQECGNCICKRTIMNESTGYYWCDSKTGCAAGSSYFPNGVGCSSWTPWGELQSLYDKIEMEERNKKERERMEREKRSIEEENERLKRENESLSRSSFSPSSSFESSPYSSHSEYESSYEIEDDSYDYDDSDYDEDLTQEELEEQLLEKYEDLSKEVSKNFKSVLKQIKDLRAQDLSNNVVDIDGLNEFMETIKGLLDSLIEAKGSKDFLLKIASVKTKFEYQANSFLSNIESEINWHYENGHYNVSYALASVLVLSGYKGSKDLLKKCKKTCISWSCEKAKSLMLRNSFDDAIQFLIPLKDEPDCKALINECYVGIDKEKIYKAKKLMADGKYEEALKILNELGHADVIELVEECEKKSIEAKIKKAKTLWASKKRKEAISLLDSIHTKEAESLKKQYISKIKKTRTIIISSIIGTVILSIILGVVIGVSAHKAKQEKIVNDIQLSLSGKTFKGSNTKYNRTFTFSNANVTVNINDPGSTPSTLVFTYSVSWGPGNYPEYDSSNDCVNLNLSSTTNSLKWRYLVSYEERGGSYYATSFTFRYPNEPFYYLV